METLDDSNGSTKNSDEKTEDAELENVRLDFHTSEVNLTDAISFIAYTIYTAKELSWQNKHNYHFNSQIGNNSVLI